MSAERAGASDPTHRLVAWAAFDYRSVLAVVVLAGSILLYVGVQGTPSWRLGFVDAALAALAVVMLVRALGSRLVFDDRSITFTGLLGPRTRVWPLDGSARINYRSGSVTSRWGLRQAGALVLTGGRGEFAMPLVKGVFRRQAEWAERLLELGAAGRLHMTPDARRELELYALPTTIH